MTENAGIRKLAQKVVHAVAIANGQSSLSVGELRAVEAELNRVLGDVLEAANGLRVVKFVSDGDGDWQAITEHSIKKLAAALERFNRGA